jgi:hypothetical protein
MTELSPQAQAVLDAVCDNTEPDCDTQHLIAAALRAAADQVVPDSDAMRSPCREHCVIGGAAARIRAELLAIAAELEGAND